MRVNKLSEPPTVAVLLSGRERFSSYYGGAVARWTYEVYSRLGGQFDVTVFGFPTGQETKFPLRHETSRAWKASDLLSRFPLARRYEETLWLRALSRKLRSYDVAHIHNRPQWVSSLRKIGYEGKIILHLHNDHVGHWSESALHELAANLDALAVCSNYLRNTFVLKSAALDAKTRVIHNGANLELFFPREELREPKTIFFVGRLDPEKGVLQLLRAFELVLKTHPGAKLVIGGSSTFGAHRETSYMKEIRQFAQDLQARGAQIYFTGYLDHDKNLPLWFQKATIFCCPSLFQEPFGLVNAEAMACATTVVGSNRGGIPEVLGETGRLVDPESVSEFADALTQLLSNPEQCRRLGNAGYERCRQKFDWQITAENWAELLRHARNSTTISWPCSA
jgi:spore coat protein SA